MAPVFDLPGVLAALGEEEDDDDEDVEDIEAEAEAEAEDEDDISLGRVQTSML
jgi:hypothetical protein